MRKPVNYYDFQGLYPCFSGMQSLIFIKPDYKIMLMKDSQKRRLIEQSSARRCAWYTTKGK